MNGIYVENIRYEFFTELSLMSNGNIIHTAYNFTILIKRIDYSDIFHHF